MILFTWLCILSPIQMDQVFQVFLSAFLAQNRHTEQELKHYYYEKMVQRLNNPELFCGVFDKEQMVGFAIFEKWTEDSYYLAEMAVVPEYQQRGVGKQLVFSIFEKEASAKKIVLVTEEANHGSRAFYERIGFRASSFKHPNYPIGFTGYEYEKSLNRHWCN